MALNRKLNETEVKIARSRKAPKGVFVGVYNEAEIRACRDINEASIVGMMHGLPCMNTRFVPEGLAVWVCAPEDCEDFIEN